MKRLILAGLSVLLVSAGATPAVKAETTALNPAVAGNTSLHQTRPFNLVYLAYQGYFRDQGIPSYSALIAAYRSGKISALDLVEAAVKTNRVPSSVLQDRGYISAVETQLDFLESN